jgi:hypothetical protein
MPTWYIVHRSDVGKPPMGGRSQGGIACATWTADPGESAPTVDDLLAWCKAYRATFPADLVNEDGSLFIADPRPFP